MIRSNDRITEIQATFSVMSCILGVSLLTLPGILARKAEGPDGWISVILGAMAAMVAAAMIVKLGLMFPGKTVFEYSTSLLGNWIGKLLSVIFWFYFLMISTFEVRALNEIVKQFLLEDTPRGVIIFVMMSVAAYLISGGINCIVRMIEITLPLALLLLCLMLGLSLKIFELDNLRPIMGEGIGSVLRAVPDTSIAYLGIDVLYFITAIMHRPEKARKAAVLGIGISMVFYTATVIVTIGGISSDNTASLTWPTISLIRSYEYAGVFFERFEPILIVLWALRVFMLYSMFYYLSAVAYTHVTKKPFNSAFLIQLPIIYILAMTPKNVNDLFKLGDYLGYAFYFFGGILPLMLLLIAKLKGGGQRGQQSE